MAFPLCEPGALLPFTFIGQPRIDEIGMPCQAIGFVHRGLASPGAFASPPTSVIAGSPFPLDNPSPVGVMPSSSSLRSSAGELDGEWRADCPRFAPPRSRVRGPYEMWTFAGDQEASERSQRNEWFPLLFPQFGPGSRPMQIPVSSRLSQGPNYPDYVEARSRPAPFGPRAGIFRGRKPREEGDQMRNADPTWPPRPEMSFSLLGRSLGLATTGVVTTIVSGESQLIRGQSDSTRLYPA